MLSAAWGGRSCESRRTGCKALAYVVNGHTSQQQQRLQRGVKLCHSASQSCCLGFEHQQGSRQGSRQGPLYVAPSHYVPLPLNVWDPRHFVCHLSFSPCGPLLCYDAAPCICPHMQALSGRQGSSALPIHQQGKQKAGYHVQVGMGGSRQAPGSPARRADAGRPLLLTLLAVCGTRAGRRTAAMTRLRRTIALRWRL